MFTKEELIRIRASYINEEYKIKETIPLAKQLWLNVLMDAPITHQLLKTIEIGDIIQTVFPGAIPGVTQTQLLAKLATTFFLFGYNAGKAVERSKQLEDLLKKE